MIALYVRVSTEEQAKRGYSLQDQIRQCKQKAGSTETMEYVDDGYSGEFLERPALTKLRNDIREGLVEKVICYDPDRLSRKLANQLIVTEEIEKRATLVFVNSEYKNTPEGILFYQMRGAFSEFEKAKIKERMTNGRRAKARNGKVVKDVKVYGYKFNKEAGELEINEDEAKIVWLIFELFTNPMGRVKGINGIAKYLTDKGVPTKKGKGIWHRQVVRQILMNETYTGVFYHNKWNTEGMLGNKYKDKDERISMTHRPREEWIAVKVPTIIDRKTFDNTQKLLKESRRRWTKNSKNNYLLSGLVRCGDCGNTMTGRRAKNWGDFVFEYTDIKNTAGAKHKGCGNRVKCELLDEEVWNAFVNVMTARLQGISEAATTQETETDETMTFEEFELKRIEFELEQIKTGRKRLLNFMSLNADVVDEEDIRNQLKEMKKREENLLNQREEAAAILENMQHEEHNEEILDEVIEEFLQVEELTVERKRSLLRKAIREIRVYSSGKVEFIRM